MPKLKPHKGLLKRVRVTGSGKVKFRRSFTSHLMSHKSGRTAQKLRQSRLAKPADIQRLERMLHRPLRSGDHRR